jgi:Uma2 family endonuclease
MGLPALKVEDLPHYTYDDLVQWEGRWEIINGIPYAMAPSPTFKHQDISQRINVQLHELLKQCPLCRPILPVDWQIAEDTVVQPDNMVICGDNTDEKKLLLTPVLVFEILSPSTARKDKILKYKLYQEAGVKYFCIVEQETLSAGVFVLKVDKYADKETFEKGKMIFDLGPCKIAFDFGEVFKGMRR